MAQHPSHAPVPSKPKKSSNVVTLSVIGAVSVMVVGYCAATSGAKSVTADCVDSRRAADGSYTVVEDRYCDDDGVRYYGGSRGAYHWYYGGTRVGSRVHGGRTVRPHGVEITSRNGRAIQRGGFGGGSRTGGG